MSEEPKVQKIEMEQAGGRLPELIAEALTGTDVVITRGQRPVVRLVDVAKKLERRRFSKSRSLITFAES